MDRRCTRRSHAKSKGGCASCKTRHVRCDEYRPKCGRCVKLRVPCEYKDAARPEAAKRSALHMVDFDPSIIPILSDDVDLKLVTGGYVDDMFTLTPESCLTPYDMPVEWPEQEKIGVHYYMREASIITKNGGHRWSLFTVAIPETAMLSWNFPCVRQTLLHVGFNLVADHFKDSAKREASIYHRTRALACLREEMGRFSPSNAQGLFTALTILVAFTSSMSSEWATLLRGTLLIREKMTSWYRASIAPTPRIALQEQNPIALPATPPCTDLSLFKPEPDNTLPSVTTDALPLAILTALHDVESYLKNDPELLPGCANLCRFIENMRLAPPTNSAEDQFKAHTAIRTRHIIHIGTHERLGRADPGLLILIAYYEAMALAFQCLNPWGAYDHLITGKANVVVKIYERLEQKDCSIIDGDGRRRTLAHLVHIPHRLAVNYLRFGVFGCTA